MQHVLLVGSRWKPNKIRDFFNSLCDWTVFSHLRTHWGIILALHFLGSRCIQKQDYRREKL